ncbi:hypothetical protein PFICI_03208 [Pestalotiopsis fici W106-1]|uniref:Transcription factor domain-containing protein n=1 Tax=Pestalotiopsis fici (strain W106-1 / CGMCC3.15140) TaxID=1229662 RepID=W3XGG4_PESFW|nr:uncharacterized protein PFICI_03208 [Pestalotiopsis fici W106-1]ETS85183.1 hypothetical protein PFICI_03208 [Pestalotiopsis fici W106-1]
MAYITFYFFKMDRDMTIEHVQKAMDALDNFQQQLPVLYSSGGDLAADDYQYATTHLRTIGWQRFAYSIGPEFMRLYVARIALGRLVGGDKSELVTRLWRRGTDAATRVIRRVADDKIPLLFLKFWPMTGSVISAGIYVVLNLLCFGTGSFDVVAAQHELVQQSINHLRRVENISCQARKGAHVLDYLLHVSMRHPSTTDITSLSDLIKHLQNARRPIHDSYEEHNRRNEGQAQISETSFESMLADPDIGEASSQVLNQFWPVGGGFTDSYAMPYSEYGVSGMDGLLQSHASLDEMQPPISRDFPTS